MGKLNGQENKAHMYMLSSRDPLQNERRTQTKSKGMEKEFMLMERGKKARVALLVSDKTDLNGKATFKRQRTLHNDKGSNPMRGCNPSTHVP